MMTAAEKIIRRIRRQKAARMVEADKSIAFAKATWDFATTDPDCVGDSYMEFHAAWMAAVRAWQDVEQNSMSRYVLM
jgi:hypothetical protein